MKFARCFLGKNKNGKINDKNDDIDAGQRKIFDQRSFCSGELKITKQQQQYQFIKTLNQRMINRLN